MSTPPQGQSPFPKPANPLDGAATLEDLEAVVRDADRIIRSQLAGVSPDDSSGAYAADSQAWPTLPDAALYGLAGDVVRAIEPHSEADSAALLLQFLAGFGNMIGKQPHFVTEADRQTSNLYVVIVGPTARGRKGTSWGQVRRILETVDEGWASARILSGLASGEGLIWAVRDPMLEHQPIRERGRVVGYQDVESDPGVTDKRLLIFETEFARVLQVAERETCTLSAVIRQAWDTGSLRILTKKQQAQATDAHISIIAHITQGELRRLLTDTATGNGFANRFLWVCARRSKLLPEGGALDTVNFAPITGRLQTAVIFARSVQRMQRDEAARAIWRDVYGSLSAGNPGLLGAVTSRADAQTVRLSCLYALLDNSRVVRAEHMMAAIAVWQYCEESSRFIFGDALGDATADEILSELRSHPEGLTRNEIREIFQRNKRSGEIGRALSVLQENALAHAEREHGERGRPSERWHALTVVRDKRG